MLATRIIPTVLCNGRQQIKGKRFDGWRSVGLAAQACKVHAMRGVDELILLDIMATREGRGPDLTLVKELTDACFMPITVGGGVKSIEDVKALLNAGADKVVIGTGAPALLREISGKVGGQAVIAAVDVLDNEVMLKCGLWGTDCDPLNWAIACSVEGAGEIMVTNIGREGTMKGYDLDLVKRVAHAVNIPVIAHGGCSGYADMLAAIQAGASAVAAGALFQFTDSTPAGAAAYLKANGVEVRIREETTS